MQVCYLLRCCTGGFKLACGTAIGKAVLEGDTLAHNNW